MPSRSSPRKGCDSCVVWHRTTGKRALDSASSTWKRGKEELAGEEGAFPRTGATLNHSAWEKCCFVFFWFCFVFSGQPSFNFALFWLVMTTSWEFASLAYFAEAVAAQRSRNCSLSNRVPEGGARAPELAQHTTSCSAGQGACTSLRSFSHRVLAPSQNKQPATQALSQSDAIWRP